jgi:hypothetical protein
MSYNIKHGVINKHQLVKKCLIKWRTNEWLIQWSARLIIIIIIIHVFLFGYKLRNDKNRNYKLLVKLCIYKEKMTKMVKTFFTTK